MKMRDRTYKQESGVDRPDTKNEGQNLQVEPGVVRSDTENEGRNLEVEPRMVRSVNGTKKAGKSPNHSVRSGQRGMMMK